MSGINQKFQKLDDVPSGCFVSGIEPIKNKQWLVVEKPSPKNQFRMVVCPNSGKTLLLPVDTSVYRMLPNNDHYERSDYYKGGNKTLNKVGIDEPIFVVRAKDKFCARVIEFWIHKAQLEGVNDKKIRDARELLSVVTRWQRVNHTRIPD